MKLTSPRYVVGAFIAGVIAFGGVGLANAQSSDTTTDSGVDSTVESIDEPATDATSDDAITDATTDDATTRRRRSASRVRRRRRLGHDGCGHGRRLSQVATGCPGTDPGTPSKTYC